MGVKNLFHFPYHSFCWSWSFGRANYLINVDSIRDQYMNCTMHMILAKSIRFIFLSSRNMIDVCFRRKTNQFMKLLLINYESLFKTWLCLRKTCTVRCNALNETHKVIFFKPKEMSISSYSFHKHSRCMISPNWQFIQKMNAVRYVGDIWRANFADVGNFIHFLKVDVFVR